MELTQGFCYALLKSHEEWHSYAYDTIAHFDFFLTRRLPRMINEHCYANATHIDKDGTSIKHIVSFSNMSIEKPTIPKTDGLSRGIRVMQLEGELLYPNEALLRGLTYSAGIFVDIKHEIFQDNVRIECTITRNVFLLSLPIAIGSIACNLTKGDRIIHLEHLPKHGLHDPGDKGGWFCIRGMVKVMQPQKTQRNNILIIRNIQHGLESWIEAQIRSIRADDKFRSTSTLIVYLLNSGVITIDIPYLKGNISVIAAFRLLGCKLEDIEQYVFQDNTQDKDPTHFESAKRLFQLSYNQLATCSFDELITTLGDPIKLDTSGNLKDLPTLTKNVQQQITGELLPHCGFNDTDTIKEKKLTYLGKSF